MALFFSITTAFATTPPPMTSDFEWKGRIVVEFSQELGSINVHDDGGIATIGYPELDVIAALYNVHTITRFLPSAKKPVDDTMYDLTRYYLIEFPTEIDLHDVINAYKTNPWIVSAEPYYIRTSDYSPNDPFFNNQWGLLKLEAPVAFDYVTGSEDVVAGIVDSGVDTDHEDLAPNIWVNPGEDLDGNGFIEAFERNNVDDDLNGFVDDFYGWNVWQNNNDIEDVGPDAGHGTHCASDVTAVTDNNAGVASLGWSARIMSAKAGDGLYVYASAAGILYCANNGANVISLSYGGPSYVSYEQNIINNAWNGGAIIFASAGNENNSLPHYPSSYDNVISVAATNQSDQKASFSCYGSSVDISAPGVSIMGAIPGGFYAQWDGTSFSCPMSAGLACLILAAEPEWTNVQIMNQIFETCDDIDAINPGYAGLLGYGRINAGNAITALFPILSLENYIFEDPTGNNDGRPDPGEDVDFFATIDNSNLDVGAGSVDISLSTDDPDIDITVSDYTFPSIPANSTVTNTGSPLQFSVAQAAVPHEADFTLTIYDSDNDVTLIEEFTQMIGRPDVLIVDDDGGSNFETWYQQDLDALGIVHDTWDVAANGDISADEFNLYDYVIWHTSNQNDPLSEEEQELITNMLNNNGRLFISGENIDEQLSGTTFYSDVLHAESSTGATYPQVSGIEGNAISSGDTLLMIGAGGGSNNFSPSVINPINGSVNIYQYLNTSSGSGISWEYEFGKLVYLSFCFEAVSSASQTSREEVLASVFEWFDTPPGIRTSPLETLPTEYSLEQNYPNPFNPTTDIIFNLPTTVNVTLEVYDTMGRNVTTLFDGVLNAGRHIVTFDASHLSSGVYFYRLQTEGFTDLKKMALLK